MAFTSELYSALIPLAKTATVWLKRQGPSEDARDLWEAVRKQSARSKGLWQRVKQLEERGAAASSDEARRLWQEVAKLQRDVYTDPETRRSEDAAGLAVLLSNYRTLAAEIDALKRGGAAVLGVAYPVDDHIEDLRGLINAVAEDQGEVLKKLRELQDWTGLEDLRMRPDLGSVADRLRMLEQGNALAAQDVSLDVHALIRNATASLEAQVFALSAQMQELQGQVAQSEKHQRGWRQQIDHILGRRPRA